MKREKGIPLNPPLFLNPLRIGVKGCPLLVSPSFKKLKYFSYKY